ncbi:MAG TPA: hypothetical protein VMR70_01020 [Flavisolibacter sp.]|nr:hypothetical protein [Flavisolibacter sp.]
MQPTIHYEVKGKFILDFDQKDFQTLQKEFRHASPILARQEAFNFYQNYIEVLLNYQGKEYTSHEELKDDLFPLFSMSTPYQSLPEVDRVMHLNFGIGVYLVIDKPIFSEDLVNTSWCLHGIGDVSCQWEDDLFIVGLTTEYAYYEHHAYDKGDNEIEAKYYNDEAEEVETYTILQTPYDWTWEGYDKLNDAVNKNRL